MATVSLDEAYGSAPAVPNRNGSDDTLRPVGISQEDLLAEIERSSLPDDLKARAREAQVVPTKVTLSLVGASTVVKPVEKPSRKVSLTDAFGKPQTPNEKPFKSLEDLPFIGGLFKPTAPSAPQPFQAKPGTVLPEAGTDLGEPGFAGRFRPLEALTADNVFQQIQRGTAAKVQQTVRRAELQGKLPTPIAELRKDPNVWEMTTELVEEAKRDPGGMGAEFLNMMVAHPEYLMVFGPAGRLGQAVTGGVIGGQQAGVSAYEQGRTATTSEITFNATLGAVMGGVLPGRKASEVNASARRKISEGQDAGAAMDAALQEAGVAPEQAKPFAQRAEADWQIAQAEEMAAAEAARKPGGKPLSPKEQKIQAKLARDRLKQESAFQEARVAAEVEAGTAEAATREANRLASASPIARMPQTGANVLDPSVPVKTPLSVGVMLGSAEAARAKLGAARTAEDILALRREARLAAERFGGLARVWSKDPRMQAAIVLGLSAPFWDDMSQEQLAGLGAAGAVLAVKPAGGMWHPEAVRRLADPLKQSLMPEQARSSGAERRAWEAGPAAAQVDRMVKNWLNRQAGTERDPLKDVRIPVGQEMKRWEEVTDTAIGSTLAKEFMTGDRRNRTVREQQDIVKGAKPEEPIYDLNAIARLYTGRGQGEEYALRALTSYLSHVGDYLRTHVPPERLQQYDLVRAVRETAANDERIAREAVKGFEAQSRARVEAQQAMPTFKSYGEVDLPKRSLELNKSGSKRQMQAVDLPAERVTLEWKELALPKELTPEQVRGVRKATKEEATAYGREEYREDIAPPEDIGPEPYVALDPSGKVIKDNFTGRMALGRTPQEAFLAGQLALEGNVMGHCVGGYCGGVVEGEQRILSLRDSKGRSYATVEIDPNPRNRITHYEDGVPQRGSFRTDNLQDIVQIKGPGNAAPPEYVLPYVQDLVKGGKWGDVRDLENAGLTDVSLHSMERTVDGLPEDSPVRKTVEIIKRRHKGQRFITLEELSQAQLDSGQISAGGIPWSSVTGRERGSVDPGLLMRLGALGLGGFIGSQMYSDNPLVGGGAGALAVLAAGRSPALLRSLKGLSKGSLETADVGLGMLSTRLSNIHPSFRWRGIKYEHNNLVRSHEYLGRVDKFLTGLEKLPRDLKKSLGLVLRSEDSQTIANELRAIGNVDLAKGWVELQKVMRELGEQLKDKGFLRELGGTYLPRIVTDREGLLNELSKIVSEARARKGKPEIDIQLRTRLEERLRDANHNAVKSRGYSLTDVEESVLISRYLREFTPGYGQPGFAKSRTIKEITERLEPFYAGLAESVHTYVRAAVNELEKAKFFGDDLRMKKKGQQLYINEDASIDALAQRLLKEGQITGAQVDELKGLLKSRFRMKATGKGTQLVKDVGYMALLTDASAAVMQSGDSFMAAYHHGLRPTLEAMARALTGRQFVRMQEFGLADLISAEFATIQGSSKWLSKMMKPMFYQIDKIGKNINLNAALIKLRQQSLSESGRAKIQEKYGRAFDEREMKQLLGDLAAKRDSLLVRQTLFAELSDAQPVSRLELPQAYLDHPNGRLLYQLHTWQLKQLDVARRDVYNQVKAGNLKKGLYNMTALLTVLGISGATGEQLKNFVLGKPLDISWGGVMDNALRTFGWSQYMQQQITSGQVQKAVGGIVLPAHFRIADDIAKGENRWLKYFPVIGRTLWERSKEGQAAQERSEAVKEKRERREERMSLEEWRERRREMVR